MSSRGVIESTSTSIDSTCSARCPRGRLISIRASSGGCVAAHDGYSFTVMPVSMDLPARAQIGDRGLERRLLAVHHRQIALRSVDRVSACREPALRESGRHHAIARGHARMQRLDHAAQVLLQPARPTRPQCPARVAWRARRGRAPAPPPRPRRACRSTRCSASRADGSDADSSRGRAGTRARIRRRRHRAARSPVDCASSPAARIAGTSTQLG